MSHHRSKPLLPKKVFVFRLLRSLALGVWARIQSAHGNSLETCGEELLGRLDAARLEVIAAYWVFNPEIGSWRLELVSPLVEDWGPLAFYSKVNSAIDAEPSLEDRLGFSVINLEGAHYRFFRQLLTSINSKKELAGVQLNRMLIGEQVLDSASEYALFYPFLPHGIAGLKPAQHR